jgi:hypothetical protein
MSGMWKVAMLIAGASVVSACSNLTAYRSSDTDNYRSDSSMAPAAAVTRTPDNIEGSSGPAVKGPTGS